MSNFFRRSRRLLAFRRLFPEAVAPWIHLRRGLLRVRWFFMYPVDRMLRALTVFLLRPFVAVRDAATWLWESFTAGLGYAADVLRESLAGAIRTVGGAFAGLWGMLGRIGRVPVWTAAALSGVFGVILTILLFLFPLMTAQPPLASIEPPPAPPPDLSGNTFTEVPVEAAATATSETAAVQPFVLPDVSAEVPDLSPDPPEEEFNPFAPLPGSPRRSPQLSLQIDTLPEREFTVVSTPPVTRTRTNASRFELLAIRDGWDRPDITRVPPADDFVPYLQRAAAMPRAGGRDRVMTTGAVLDAQSQESQRLPTLRIEKLMPEEAAVGEPLRYEIVVSNEGEEPLDDVTVRERVPHIERVADVRPQATIVEGELHWELARLNAGEQRRLLIELRPAIAAPLEQTSRVQVTTQVAADTLVQAPRPELPEPSEEPERADPFPADPPAERVPTAPVPRPILPPTQPVLPPLSSEAPADPEPEEDPPVAPFTSALPEGPHQLEFRSETMPRAGVGHEVWTVFEVHNPTDAAAVDLVLRVNLSGALAHEQGRVLEHRIEHVGAGETYRTKLTTTAVRGGTGTVTSVLTDRRVIEESARSQVQIVQRAPLAWGPRRSRVLPSRPLFLPGCCPCGS